MSKISLYVLFIGLALGFLVGVIAVYAALDHNPQQIFTDNPIELIPIFLGNAGGISFPFSFVSALLGIIQKVKNT